MWDFGKKRKTPIDGFIVSIGVFDQAEGTGVEPATPCGATQFQ